MKRLLYISESNINELDAPATVLHIVATSQLKNAALALTGALLFTGVHFAQIIEGPTASIKKLMISLANDQRHGNIMVVDESRITAREFPEWKMAYAGPSQFVSRHVTILAQDPLRMEQRRAIERLIELIYQFSRP